MILSTSCPLGFKLISSSCQNTVSLPFWTCWLQRYHHRCEQLPTWYDFRGSFESPLSKNVSFVLGLMTRISILEIHLFSSSITSSGSFVWSFCYTLWQKLIPFPSCHLVWNYTFISVTIWLMSISSTPLTIPWWLWPCLLWVFHFIHSAQHRAWHMEDVQEVFVVDWIHSWT